MKFKLFLFVFIILMVSACGGSAEPANTPLPPTETPLPNWPEFTSEVGGFVVKLPSTPSEQVQTVPTDAGDMDLYIYMVEDGNAAFGVMFNELPEMIASVADDETIKMMLDSGRDGALANAGGTLTQEEEILIDGNPGRHIVFDISEEVIPGGGEGVMRILYVNGKVFQVITIGAEGASSPEIIEMFLDSFELIP